MSHWFDDSAPDGVRASVAYVEASEAWVAACSPLVPANADSDSIGSAANRFIAAARARGLRACFFACEGLGEGDLPKLLIGEQPIFRPRQWLRELSRHRRLREQLRRARAKGLIVRAVAPAELEEGSPLRLEVEQLAHEWLCSRHIEPMAFLAAVEPFRAPTLHRYFVADLAGRAVAFLSAVPIGARRAWLVEDVVRSAAAPNGTTETLLVALMRQEQESDYITLGLTPLAGPVGWPLRLARWVARPLFDFEGLRTFRARLHAQEWQPVWLVSPRGQSHVLSVIDSLQAFARGSLARFAARSFARHPNGLPWALALPLPLWTVGLGGLVAARRSSLLGFTAAELILWVVFDALLLFVLVRAAMRPTRSRLRLATAIAAVDAGLTLAHLVWVGRGATALEACLRATAALGPVIGSALLAWATTRTAADRRPRQPAAGSPRWAGPRFGVRGG